jgi:hypothetical protein
LLDKFVAGGPFVHTAKEAVFEKRLPHGAEERAACEWSEEAETIFGTSLDSQQFLKSKCNFFILFRYFVTLNVSSS